MFLSLGKRIDQSAAVFHNSSCNCGYGRLNSRVVVTGKRGRSQLTLSSLWFSRIRSDFIRTADTHEQPSETPTIILDICLGMHRYLRFLGAELHTMRLNASNFCQ